MKVAVQRPLVSEGGVKFAGFVNSVFEVKLRPLDTRGRWHVLEECRPSESSQPARLPILHKGFFDSHLHMTWGGLAQLDLDLKDCRSFDEMLALVEAKRREGGSFVRGFGWDETKLGMTLGSITKLAEERLPEGVPVILYRNCAHSALTNKSMRALARREDLSALVTDQNLPSVHDHLPPPSETACIDAFLRSQARAVEFGITAVGDMSLDETTVAGIRSVARQGRLQIDVAGMIDGGKAPSVESTGPFLIENASMLGPLDRKASFRVQHWKKFLDGSIGSRTAWMSRSFDDAETFGEPLIETRALAEAAAEALREGFCLSFHAIGDAALDQILDLADRLRSPMEARTRPYGSSLPSVRHRLEHVQVVRDDQMMRLRDHGFWLACVQPNHRVTDDGFARLRLGEARHFSQAYRAKGFLNHDIPIGLGSDAPVDSLDPLDAVRAAMGHPNPAERLSFDEAVWWFTTGSRLVSGLDPGKLGPGATVCLTENPLSP